MRHANASSLRGISLLKVISILRGTTIAPCAFALCAAYSAQHACRQVVTTTFEWWLWSTVLTGSHYPLHHHYSEASTYNCPSLHDEYYHTTYTSRSRHHKWLCSELGVFHNVDSYL